MGGMGCGVRKEFKRMEGCVWCDDVVGEEDKGMGGGGVRVYLSSLLRCTCGGLVPTGERCVEERAPVFGEGGQGRDGPEEAHLGCACGGR